MPASCLPNPDGRLTSPHLMSFLTEFLLLPSDRSHPHHHSIAMTLFNWRGIVPIQTDPPLSRQGPKRDGTSPPPQPNNFVQRPGLGQSDPPAVQGEANRFGQATPDDGFQTFVEEEQENRWPFRNADGTLTSLSNELRDLRADVKAIRNVTDAKGQSRAEQQRIIDDQKEQIAHPEAQLETKETELAEAKNLNESLRGGKRKTIFGAASKC